MRPTNGSTIVLKTCAEKASSVWRSLRSPSLVSMPMATWKYGVGMYSTMPFMSFLTPMFCLAEPQKTGKILPAWMPSMRAAATSTSVISVPSMYFSSSSLLNSATDSMSFWRASSTSPLMYSGMSAMRSSSSCVTIFMCRARRSTTPWKAASWPIGSCTGTTPSPKRTRSSSTT